MEVDQLEQRGDGLRQGRCSRRSGWRLEEHRAAGASTSYRPRAHATRPQSTTRLSRRSVQQFGPPRARNHRRNAKRAHCEPTLVHRVWWGLFLSSAPRDSATFFVFAPGMPSSALRAGERLERTILGRLCRGGDLRRAVRIERVEDQASPFLRACMGAAESDRVTCDVDSL